MSLGDHSVFEIVKKLFLAAIGLWLLLAAVGFGWTLFSDLRPTGYLVLALFLALIPVLYWRGRLDITTAGALIGSFLLVESIVSLAVYSTTGTAQHFLLMAFFGTITVITWNDPGAWFRGWGSSTSGGDDDWPIEDDDGSSGRAIVYETVWGEDPTDDDGPGS